MYYVHSMVKYFCENLCYLQIAHRSEDDQKEVNIDSPSSHELFSFESFFSLSDISHW